MITKIKYSIFSILALILVLSVSCEKKDSEITFDELLGNKHVGKLFILDNKLWVFSSSENQSLYIGTWPECHVSVLNLESEEFITSDVPSIISVTIDTAGKVFIAGYDRRIYKLNDDLSYEEYFRISGTAPINSILFDQNNELWVATYAKGLINYNGTDTIVFDASDSILSSNNIPPMVVDTESNIWLIRSSELFKIDISKTITRDPFPFPVNNNTGTNDLSIDKNNTLWVSKWDGITCRIFNKGINAPWAEVSTPYLYGSVKFIKTDKNGTIWLCYSDYPKDYITYFEDGNWIKPRIPLDEINIFDFEIYNNQLFLGTSHGIYRTALK